MNYTVIIQRAARNYAAWVPDLPGCVATAHTREELLDEIREAAGLHVESLRDHGEPVPEPRSTAVVVEVSTAPAAQRSPRDEAHPARRLAETPLPRDAPATRGDLHLLPRHRAKLEAIFREHLPDVEVWAYGSRVTGESHDGSDLDLVLRGPNREKIELGRLGDFREAVEGSTIPFLVEARDWARIPEYFHRGHPRTSRSSRPSGRPTPPQTASPKSIESDSRQQPSRCPAQPAHWPRVSHSAKCAKLVCDGPISAWIDLQRRLAMDVPLLAQGATDFGRRHPLTARAWLADVVRSNVKLCRAGRHSVRDRCGHTSVGTGVNRASPRICSIGHLRSLRPYGRC